MALKATPPMQAPAGDPIEIDGNSRSSCSSNSSNSSNSPHRRRGRAPHRRLEPRAFGKPEVHLRSKPSRHSLHRRQWLRHLIIMESLCRMQRQAHHSNYRCLPSLHQQQRRLLMRSMRSRLQFHPTSTKLLTKGGAGHLERPQKHLRLMMLPQQPRQSQQCQSNLARCPMPRMLLCWIFNVSWECLMCRLTLQGLAHHHLQRYLMRFFPKHLFKQLRCFLKRQTLESYGIRCQRHSALSSLVSSCSTRCAGESLVLRAISHEDHCITASLGLSLRPITWISEAIQVMMRVILRPLRALPRVLCVKSSRMPLHMSERRRDALCMLCIVLPPLVLIDGTHLP